MYCDIESGKEQALVMSIQFHLTFRHLEDRELLYLHTPTRQTQTLNTLTILRMTRIVDKSDKIDKMHRQMSSNVSAILYTHNYVSRHDVTRTEKGSWHMSAMH